MGYELTGLEGKVAVVTGAGRMRSIGRPIAIALAKAGCDIVLTGTGRPAENYPDDEKAAGWRDIASVAEEVEAEGRRALAVVSNVADGESVQGLVQQTLKEFGRVDIVVNNAGAARGEDRVPIVDLAEHDWHKVIDVNLTGTFLMSKYFGKQMIEAGNGGSIINISSIAGKLWPANSGAYASSKAGIQALTAAMSAEIGQHNVRVNAICPGIIDTYRMDDIPRGDTWNKMVQSRIPLGRAGSGEDIAHQVVYLCSDQGDWITGQSYTVDGGTAPGR
ncbi:SDR family NAD(P)-dependent oxidoreductase [Cumulibacter soli]|uniref:SDR family NAD(P)-dependent oxidoreductase n=1 Tax=Cumulibacter soli TaxID=2546344 RepID=UPI001067C75B|nr:SDR family oxidoreductase [Cumulibacter soli]